MNLQENIDRIKEVMGVINESKFFHRRVDLDKVKKLFPILSEQVYSETESYEQFKYELALKAVEYVMYDEHQLGWEHLPEQEEIEFVTEVSNIFDDIIKNLYKVMGGVINESQYSNNLKRRVHILDSLIDNLLPNMYPCDFDNEDDFVNGVYHELHHLIEDEQYSLDNLDMNDIVDYISQNREDEIREYYNERCNRIQEGLNDKWTRGKDTVTLKQLLKITKDIPVTKMLTKKLMKHALHGDNPEEMDKIDKTNLKYPVLVLVNDNDSIKYILDGHHRIQKANKNNFKSVNVKLVKFSELPKEFKKVLG